MRVRTAKKLAERIDLYYFTRREIELLLTGCGFAIESVYGAGYRLRAGER